jgi:catecholate siderophore receptor
VYDAFDAYRFNKNLELRANLLNLADNDYYLAGYRSGSFVYKGDARALRMTLNMDF